MLQFHYSYISTTSMEKLEGTLLASFSESLIEILYPFRSHQLMLTGKSSDIDLKTLILINSCQSRILQLYILILTNNPNILSTSHEFARKYLHSSTLPIILSNLVVDESSQGHVRHLAAQLLIFLLSHLPDLYDMLLVPLVDAFNSSSMDYCPQLENMSKSYVPHPERNSLENLLFCIQSLRPPDSINKSSGYVGAFTIVCALSQIKKYRLQTTNHQPLNTASICLPTCSCWKCFQCDWIMRSLHDRRALIRLMAVNVIRNSICTSYRCSCRSTDENEVQSSHLYESLSHMLLDTLESPAVRVSCLKVLTLICAMEHPHGMQETPNDISTGKPHFHILLGYIADCLTPTTFSNIPSFLLSALQSFLSLLNIPYFSSRDSFIGLIISLKIIPKVVNLLHPSSFAKIIESCEERLRLKLLPLESSTSYLCSSVNRFLSHESSEFSKVRTISLLIIQRIHEIGGLLFAATLRHTNIVKNLFSILTSNTLFTPGKSSNLNQLLESQLLSTAFDLLSIMIFRDQSPRNESLGDFEIGDLISDKSFFTASIGDSVKRILHDVYRHKQQFFKKSMQLDQSIENLFLSVLHSLSLMCTTEWRTGLSLGGRFEGCLAADPSTVIYDQLLQLWSLGEEPFIKGSLNKIIFTFSCLLDHSHGLRMKFQEKLHEKDSIESKITVNTFEIFRNFTSVISERQFQPPIVTKGLQKIKEKIRSLKTPQKFQSSPWYCFFLHFI